jgi:eukaryotic-like serine/threonine-protein kinase
VSVDWNDLERIFEQARVLPPEAQAAFVSRTCDSDEMRREALALLAADAAASEFLTKPALDRLAESIGTEGWSLTPGAHIGAYTITRLLGAGGMGEVWRARDDRLGRDVAIKILLPHFSTDSDRLRRFADEARAAGSLNHSNILTVYDVGQHKGMPFLVAECLEGSNLRQRLNAGPMPVAEAVTLALGIAHGLAAAHARGIVHRDLKPENIFITADAGVKILDFGLAKLQSHVSANEMSETVSGVIVGTAGYIAPEQLKNEPVDARADLFVLGAILYEMLDGRNPFRRDNTFETLNAILTVDPPHLSAGERVPPSLARVVMRLLEKAPHKRFQSAIDLAWALEQPADHSPQPVKTAEPRPWWQTRLATWTATAAAIALAAGWQLRPETAAVPGRIEQFPVTLPPGVSLASAPAVSTDGQHIAFAGIDAKGSRLYVRTLSQRDASAVRGTDGATRPFWSADGAAIGYFARGQLTTLAWPRGAPVPLAPAPFAFGATWSASGTILFAPDVILTGISRVPARGGRMEPATQLDPSTGDTSHWWPVVLPDGKHFLYHVRSTRDDRIGVYLGRVSELSAPTSPLLRSHSDVVYVRRGDSEGVLLYVTGGRIEARRFDATTLTVASDAKSLGLAAGGTNLYHPVMLGASRDVLAFAESEIPTGDRLEAVDRNGHRVRFWADAEALNWPRLSPDGTRLAVQRVDPLRNNPEIWVEYLDTQNRVRITSAPAPDIQPVWSPDGNRLAYVTGNPPGRTGDRTLSIAAADGTRTLRSFACPTTYCEPTDWSVDGRLLLNVRTAEALDVWTIHEDGSGAEPVLAGSFSEYDARFSPDGEWLAYVSEESGRAEVSVRTISGSKRIPISAHGGAEPVWRRDGSELFFVDPEGRLLAVPVRWRGDRSPVFGMPHALKVPPVGFGHWGTQYDVSRDGNHIYALRENRDPGPREIRVVRNWQRLLD